MSEDDFSPKGRLLSYLEHYVAGMIDASVFCGAFEAIYNLELDKTVLSPRERQVLDLLFEKVAWYSPLPGERAQIPNYVGEAAIGEAARDALATLREQLSDDRHSGV